MPTLTVRSRHPRQVIDITEAVSNHLPESTRGDGICHLFTRHTTAALTVMDLDPGTDEDLLDALREMVPKLRYRHPHDPSHVPSHILSAIIGASLTLPMQGGRLALGTWQRVVLVELDGPRERDVLLTVIPG